MIYFEMIFSKCEFDISGERLKGRGSDLYQLCSELDKTIAGKFKLYCISSI